MYYTVAQQEVSSNQSNSHTLHVYRGQLECTIAPAQLHAERPYLPTARKCLSHDNFEVLSWLTMSTRAGPALTLLLGCHAAWAASQSLAQDQDMCW